MTTGERIREKRLQAGMTQKELADLIGYDGKYKGDHLSGIEHGRFGISIEKLIAISEILHTNAFYLLGITSNDQLTNKEALAIIPAALDAAKVDEPPQKKELDPKCMRVLNAISAVRIARG